ncbi:MAG: DUF3987 domain-containing protein [Bacteroidales bacterium]|nr:DUF3987 domain-containing protein [Bacteroidales bacterium]
MNFDVYFSFKNKQGKWCPGVRPKSMEFSAILRMVNDPRIAELVTKHQAGEPDCKIQLPAICWTGRCTSDYRRDDKCEPTQFVMIDIDHMEDAKTAWQKSFSEMQSKYEEENLSCVHITPSGKGLRFVFRATRNIRTLSEYMLYLDDVFKFHLMGDFDASVKNLGRISFLPQADYFLYTNETILSGLKEYITNPIKEAGSSIVEETNRRKKEEPKRAPVQPTATQTNLDFDGGEIAFTDEEKQAFDAFRYRGFEIPIIVNKYLEVFGQPGDGEKHNFYNEMVKNFRCILDNNKRLILYFMPTFGHSLDERWSQIVSICRVNTLSRLPKNFYFFLKDNGFYDGRGQRVDDLKKYMMEEEQPQEKLDVYFPPVFRELVGIAPKDFIVPVVNALLPILGTLTSYVRATYPYDGREHSTSFFTVIYAPPGTGKGFCERFLDLLFEDLKLRDLIQSERENVYLRALARKGANDKAPDMPHTSLRLIPPKNSEAEFLQKQRDNGGFHMFTYAAEMDSWAKGVKAAGGNKDDMIRIAWDNGEYGQQFKSFNTFKGTVQLYWNVLITGTLQQVLDYFKNVENGLVTRCSFCSIENQEFAPPPIWRKLSNRAMAVIKKFRERCDMNTYETPCIIDPTDLLGVNDENFDKEVEWRFKFRDKKKIDMSWVMPTINAFHSEQMKKAALDIDRARDVFRRRVAVRGFRLGMICTCLWENPRKTDLEKCCQFIDWYMHQDIENMMGLWGVKYNEQSEVMPHVVQRTVFDALNDNFDRNDVYIICTKQGIKTPVRRILHDWKKLSYIKQIDKEHYTKIVKKS